MMRMLVSNSSKNTNRMLVRQAAAALVVSALPFLTTSRYVAASSTFRTTSSSKAAFVVRQSRHRSCPLTTKQSIIDRQRVMFSTATDNLYKVNGNDFSVVHGVPKQYRVNGIEDSKNKKALSAKQLRWICDPSQFQFKTTAKLLEDTNDNVEKAKLLGQERAESAIEFGLGMKRDGYNLFILGPPGSGKRTVIQKYLQEHAKVNTTAAVYDWCYVQNFDDVDKPKAIKLPVGHGRLFQDDMEQFIDDLKTSIPTTLESNEHRQKLEGVDKEYMNEYDQKVSALAKEAREKGFDLIRTQKGMAIVKRATVPVNPYSFHKEDESNGNGKNGEEVEKKDEETGGFLKQLQAAMNGNNKDKGKDDIVASSEDKDKKIVEELEPQLRDLVQSYPQVINNIKQKKKQINQEAVKDALEFLMKPLKQRHDDNPDIVTHLEAVEADVIEHSDEFQQLTIYSSGGGDGIDGLPDLLFSGLQSQRLKLFDRYLVNLLVDHNKTEGTAPVIYEDHPHYNNLVGHVEHISYMGSLTTDFSLIKSGALHRANGGYLVLQARDILTQPFAWEALKRSLRSGTINMESLGAELSLISTVSLQPEPIPLDVKVVLLGDRMLYYLLQAYDDEFNQLFKVEADFNDQTDRTDETCQLYAKMLANLADSENARHMDPEAVALMLEQASRYVSDQEKLSTHMRSTADLLRESDYYASCDGKDIIGKDHVSKAIQQQIYRSDRISDLIKEAIERGTILVDVTGEKVGQVNGLSVMSLGNLAFGRPSRITATGRLGRGKLIDIERESELGGSIHSKGVMILSSLLASRYAKDVPLSLSASLVFEQSYGQIEGDSASVAEFCALLSVLSNVPIKQGLAITGSLNQFGEAQAIGGVNEKIEGFYDVCNSTGLTGDQGVLIPSSNVKNLMLRPDVVDAVRNGKFTIYSYDNVDDAISLLTGVDAGEKVSDIDDAVNGLMNGDMEKISNNNYPEGTINYLVDKKLHELADLMVSYSDDSSKGDITANEDSNKSSGKMRP